jgi:hypothetical protein
MRRIGLSTSAMALSISALFGGSQKKELPFWEHQAAEGKRIKYINPKRKGHQTVLLLIR